VAGEQFPGHLVICDQTAAAVVQRYSAENQVVFAVCDVLIPDEPTEVTLPVLGGLHDGFMQVRKQSTVWPMVVAMAAELLERLRAEIRRDAQLRKDWPGTLREVSRADSAWRWMLMDVPVLLHADYPVDMARVVGVLPATVAGMSKEAMGGMLYETLTSPVPSREALGRRDG
jgi:hypothetical protein